MRYAPDPDLPGWMIWEPRSAEPMFSHALGPMRVRTETATAARVRIWPQVEHRNLAGALHGGFTLAFIDVALFICAVTVGSPEARNSVTLELSNQFVSAAKVGEAVDAVVELVRESGRLIFLRGVVTQGDATVASFSGILSKRPSAA